MQIEDLSKKTLASSLPAAGGEAQKVLPPVNESPAPENKSSGGGSDSNRERVLESIGAFLRRHQLPCTKQTLYFAFAVATGESAYLRALLQRREGSGEVVTESWIGEAISNAYSARRQRQAAEPAQPKPQPRERPAPQPERHAKEDDELIDELDRLGTVFASMLARHAEGTEKFAGQLADSENALSGPDPVSAVEDLLWKVKGVLVWQRKAERELAGARRKIAALKTDLEKAKEEASHDSLTGLPNRKGLLARFGEFQQQGRSAAIALIDIDHFKNINDTFGHPVGDEVLKMVSGFLRHALGEAFVARYGGEEFAVIFDTSVIRTAFEQIDYARRKLGERRLFLAGGETQIAQLSFSAGVSAFLPQDSFEQVMEEVDDLLYRAKKTGRARVACR